MRNITYAEAIGEAILQLMEVDSSVFVMGLGVDDPSGIFGTTTLANNKFPKRFIGTPISENAMTGVALGAAVGGMRPISTHQRMDFLLMAMDQISNHLAKWDFLMAGKSKAPVTIRAIIGKGVGGGWGQACQHAQSLQAIFANIPGLKIVMPYSAYDAKGLLISSVKSNCATIFVEHRSIYREKDNVPENIYEVPFGKAKKLKEGNDVTVIGLSSMNTEIKRALIELEKLSIDAEWIDLRSVKPWDKELVYQSVKKTNKLVIAETGHRSFGVSAEIVSSIVEEKPGILKKVRRISLPDFSIPAGPTIEKEYYPDAFDIVTAVLEVLGKNEVIGRDQMNLSENSETFRDAF